MSAITITFFRLDNHFGQIIHSIAMKNEVDPDEVRPKITEDGSGIASAPGPHCPGMSEPLGKQGFELILRIMR